MTKQETSNLTMAMAYSGETLDLTDISDIIIDKHSTGGVGDKITIILMPIISALGIPVAKITNMDEPVGQSIGTQLEIIESVNALKGSMSKDVEEITYALAAQILIMANKSKNIEEAYSLIKETINSGKAYEKFKQLVIQQCGDISYIEDLSKFKSANYIVPVLSKKAGYVSKINTEEIGKISSFIGAGRQTKNDIIDFQAGIIMNKKINDFVSVNEPLLYIHTNKKEVLEEATLRLQNSFTISENKVDKLNNIIKII